jgi:hypothetical protein
MTQQREGKDAKRIIFQHTYREDRAVYVKTEYHIQIPTLRDKAATTAAMAIVTTSTIVLVWLIIKSNKLS